MNFYQGNIGVKAGDRVFFYLKIVHVIYKASKQLLAGMMRPLIHCDDSFVQSRGDVTVSCGLCPGVSSFSPQGTEKGNFGRVTPDWENSNLSALLNLYLCTGCIAAPLLSYKLSGPFCQSHSHPAVLLSQWGDRVQAAVILNTEVNCLVGGSRLLC